MSTSSRPDMESSRLEVRSLISSISALHNNMSLQIFKEPNPRGQAWNLLGSRPGRSSPASLPFTTTCNCRSIRCQSSRPDMESSRLEDRSLEVRLLVYSIYFFNNFNHSSLSYYSLCALFIMCIIHFQQLYLKYCY